MYFSKQCFYFLWIDTQKWNCWVWIPWDPPRIKSQSCIRFASDSPGRYTVSLFPKATHWALLSPHLCGDCTGTRFATMKRAQFLSSSTFKSLKKNILRSRYKGPSCKKRKQQLDTWKRVLQAAQRTGAVVQMTKTIVIGFRIFEK